MLTKLKNKMTKLEVYLIYLKCFLCWFNTGEYQLFFSLN